MRIAETPVHNQLLRGPQVWTERDYPAVDGWVTRLDGETIDDLVRAAKNQSLDEITRARFSTPATEVLASRCRNELLFGRGFVLLRGLPIDELSDEAACAIYVGLGRLLGVTLPQNVKLELLYAVRDEGYSIDKQWGRVGVRFSKTTQELNFHTDSAPALLGATPDVVGLLALQVAMTGGASALVSAYSIHNALLAESPGLLQRLYSAYHIDRRAEVRPGEPLTLQAPIFTYSEATGLHMRYFRFYIPKGHDVAGVPLDAEDLRPLDAIDRIAARPEMQVTFEMRRGDIQLVSNNYVLHSRTAFQDHPEPERRRHLKRLWLAVK
ncbi:MAG: TauD/TfdA family dioxygenase [Acidobacteria bacterium]|nr:TauD/TfdA family dioxygenase [Acidobacteriota bacterium]